MNKKIYILGNGGHAKVLKNVLDLMNESIDGNIIEDDNFINDSQNKSSLLVNGIGGVKDSLLRKRIYEKYKSQDFSFLTAIHPSSVIDKSVKLSEGAQVFAGAIIQSSTLIGENSIINTGAIVDHDCKIGAHVHIAPGVVISGGVFIGEGSFIGIGARVIQNIKIGKNCLVAAGAVVINDIGDGDIVMGTPAKKKSKNNGN